MSKILIAQENSIWYTELHDNMINAKWKYNEMTNGGVGATRTHTHTE